MNDLQPAYTQEQVDMLNQQKELDDLRDALNDEWRDYVRCAHHRAHYKKHLARQTLVKELRSLRCQSDEGDKSVQEKVEALLQKYDERTYPVIFVNGEYHSEYSEEAELELTAIPVFFNVYYLTAAQKDAVLKQKLSELELPL